MRSDPLLSEIGSAHDKSAVQVTLRWLLQKGITAIPKSATPANIEANFAVFDFELSDEEMKRIDAIPNRERLINWSPGSFDEDPDVF